MRNFLRCCKTAQFTIIFKIKMCEFFDIRIQIHKEIFFLFETETKDDKSVYNLTFFWLKNLIDFFHQIYCLRINECLQENETNRTTTWGRFYQTLCAKQKIRRSISPTIASQFHQGILCAKIVQNSPNLCDVCQTPFTIKAFHYVFVRKSDTHVDEIDPWCAFCQSVEVKE